jgi:hypothetical protein
MLLMGEHNTFLSFGLVAIGMTRPVTHWGIALVAFLLLVLGPAVSAQVSEIPPRGEWLVEGTEALIGATNVWNGNITVAPGGELTIRRSTLIFNSTEFVHYGIVVQGGGKIVIQESNLTTAVSNGTMGLIFLVDGSVEVRDTAFQYMYGFTQNVTWISGFKIASESPVVEGSFFYGGAGFGPRFVGSTDVVFRDNLVVGSSTGILMEDSTGVLEGNFFQANTDRQVVIRDCDGVEFTNNTLNLTGMGGLVVVRSRNVLTGDNRYDGDFYVIYVSDRSFVTMSNEEITGQQIQVHARGESSVTILDTPLNFSKIQVIQGAEVVVERTVTVKVVAGGNPKSGAMIDVFDADELLVAEGTTGDDGTADFEIAVLRVTDAGSDPYGPHEFKAVKGIYSASGSADISVSGRIELTMSLPWMVIAGIGVVVVVAILLAVTAPRAGKKKGKAKKK